jgi:hypothetical protein
LPHPFILCFCRAKKHICETHLNYLHISPTNCIQ